MVIMGISLANSNICRICAVEYTEGFGLFEESEDKASLVILINKYLPISVVNDGLYPEHICERCHTGVAATVDLIDRMVEGQHTLRTMLQKATAIKKEIEEPTSSAESSSLPSTTLVDLQGNAPDIPMDDITRGCEAVKVYGSAHPLTHSAGGTTVKRKRGRPKKVQTLPNQNPVQQYNHNSTTDIGRPRRKTSMPSRFRDTVAGEALESLMLSSADVNAFQEVGFGGEPRIFVAGEGPEAAPATDVPFALNIEILEQDGHFILRGIEHLGDFKQLETARPGDQQGTLVLQPNSSLAHQKDSIHLQTPTHIENGYLLNDACTIDSKLDFSSLKSDDFSSSGIILNSSLKSEQFSSSSIILNSSAGNNAGQGTLVHESELEHYDIIASGQQYQISIPKEYQHNHQQLHNGSNNNQNNHLMQQSLITGVQQQQQQPMLSNPALSHQHNPTQQQQFRSTLQYQAQQQQNDQLPQESRHEQEVQFNLTQCTPQLHQPEPQLQFTNSSDGQQFLQITSSGSPLQQDQQPHLHFTSTSNLIPTQQQQFHTTTSPITTQFDQQHQQQPEPPPQPQAPLPQPQAPPPRSSVKRNARRGPRRKPRYKCNICAKTFLREGRYKHHIFLHGTVLVQCVVCSIKFHDRQQLTDHQLLTGHQGVGIVELSHLSSDAPATELRCKVCPNRTFVSLEGYEKHMNSVHERGGKPISCNQCDKKFVYQHSLRCHVRQCHQEGALFGGDLSSERQHPCLQCRKVFGHLSSLAYHTDTVHNNGRFFVCSLCGMPFRHKQLLQRHYAVHSTLRPHECHICKKTFKTRCNLANHLVCHSQEKKYTCEICGKQFNHVTSITLHIRSHTGEKPFACPHCDKKFAQNGNLQEHIRIHTGEKPFSCTVCLKRFTTSSQARHHARVHVGKDKNTSGGGNKNSSYSLSRKTTSNQTTIHIKNAITNNDLSEGSVAITYLPSFCSGCCETLEDAEAVQNHRCQSIVKSDPDDTGTDASHPQQKREQLHLLAAASAAGGSHTWLVAGPAASEGGDGTGGNGAATDTTSNIIYILSENDEDGSHSIQGHTYETLQQGSVQLDEAGQLVQTGGENSWQQQQQQQHDGLQMYSSDGGELLPALVASAAGDQPTAMQQERAEEEPSKQSSGPISLLLNANPTKLIAQLQHHP